MTETPQELSARLDALGIVTMLVMPPGATKTVTVSLRAFQKLVDKAQANHPDSDRIDYLRAWMTDRHMMAVAQGERNMQRVHAATLFYLNTGKHIADASEEFKEFEARLRYDAKAAYALKLLGTTTLPDPPVSVADHYAAQLTQATKELHLKVGRLKAGRLDALHAWHKGRYEQAVQTEDTKMVNAHARALFFIETGLEPTIHIEEKRQFISRLHGETLDKLEGVVTPPPVIDTGKRRTRRDTLHAAGLSEEEVLEDEAEHNRLYGHLRDN